MSSLARWLTRLGTAALSLTAVVACSGGDDGAPTASSSQALTPACPTRDALFEVPAWMTSCPSIPGWSQSALFSNAAGGSLYRFCRYSWNGAGWPSANHFGSLTTMLQTATNSQNVAEPDCPVVGALGLVDLPAMYDPLIANFRKQASRVSSLPAAPSRTRVAVIDGAARPFEATYPDTSGHGRTVGRVIHDLACPPGGYCASEIRNYVALPMIDPETADYYKGGYFGTRGQLASAIVAAVENWVHDYKKSPKLTPPRLVLNLSVGWTPEHGGDPFDSVPSRAVYHALQHAACYGALVIAAAGNDSGGASSGPMYPGGWEQIPAPTKCGKPYSGFSTLPLWPSPGAYAPLVNAASAVDGTDRPSRGTRPGGQSRLVAYGTDVVTSDVRAPGRTLVLSGTSMASAIASGAAAITWAYAPYATADQVMNYVYATSVELTPGDPSAHAVTNFCLGSSCSSWPLRRVSICNVVKPLTGLKCGTPPAHSGDSPDLPDPGSLYPMPSSGPGPMCTLGSGTASSCNTEGDTMLMTPWVDPQPNPGCDLCTITIPTGDLWLDLVASHLETIYGITFVGYDARGNAITSQRILSPTGTMPYPEIFRTSVYSPTNLVSAELHFAIYESGRSYYTREPLQVPRY